MQMSTNLQWVGLCRNQDAITMVYIKPLLRSNSENSVNVHLNAVGTASFAFLAMSYYLLRVLAPPVDFSKSWPGII